MMTERLIIAQQKRWAIDLAEDHIQVAVAVDVRERRAAPDDWFEEVRSGFLGRDIEEARAVSRTGIPEKLSGLRIALAALDFADLLFKMAIGAEQIQPAIQVIVEKEHPELQQEPAGWADAFRDRFVCEGHAVFGRRDVKSRHLVGKIADGDTQGFGVSIVGRVNAHGAARIAVAVEGDSG